MKVILDCNIWISFLLGHQTVLMQHLLTNSSIDIYVCSELLAEIEDVGGRQKIRKYIRASDVAILFDLLHDNCVLVKINSTATYPVRDAKDLYLLSLAETVKADILVSGDKDLLVLKQHGATRILTLAELKNLLGYEA